jgi:hypothetical protein
MRTRYRTPLLLGTLGAVLLASSAAAQKAALRSPRPPDAAARGSVRSSDFDPWTRGPDRGPRGLRGYQDPAFARGYSDGWERGANDRHDRNRYDPVRHHDYRDADDGYFRSYGPKDYYRNNYRDGFRRGYEEGFRNGSGWRR